MKHFFTSLFFFTSSLYSYAGLINWESDNFATDPKSATLDSGDLVALYIDVNGDSGLSGLVVNPDFSVNILNSASNMADDVFAGFTTTVQVPFPALKTINSLLDINIVPDNALIYTVMFDSPTLTPSTLGIISDDSPFNSGSAVAPAPSIEYGALGSDGVLSGNMGGVSVIPEPTTLMALLVGIVGLVGFRRHLLKK